MHTSRHEIEGVEYHCAYNGDFSGDVLVAVEVPEDLLLRHPGGTVSAKIPFKLMRELVGQAEMQLHINMIESMTGEEFLDARN